jgi:hypothetical protein
MKLVIIFPVNLAPLGEVLNHKSLFFHRTVYRPCHFVSTQTCDSMQRLCVELLKTNFLPQRYGYKTTKHVCLCRKWRQTGFLIGKFSGLFLRERSSFYFSFKTYCIIEDKFDSTFYPCVTDTQNWVGDTVQIFFCSVDRAYRYICVIKTNLMYYLT